MFWFEIVFVINFRADLNLALLEKEKTHDIELELTDGEGTTGYLKILLTISGLTHSSNSDNESIQINKSEIVKKYVSPWFQ